MVPGADEWEEVNTEPVNSTQEVYQVSVWSNHQLQLHELMVKEKKKEITPEGPPTSKNTQGKSEEQALPSNSNSNDATKGKESIKEPKKDLPIQVPF